MALICGSNPATARHALPYSAESGILLVIEIDASSRNRPVSTARSFFRVRTRCQMGQVVGELIVHRLAGDILELVLQDGARDRRIFDVQWDEWIEARDLDPYG